MGGLTHASPAGTPTQAYEDELLWGYGAEAKPEVFIVTSRTMVAINNHRLTVLREEWTAGPLRRTRGRGLGPR